MKRLLRVFGFHEISLTFLFLYVQFIKKKGENGVGKVEDSLRDILIVCLCRP